MQISSEEKNRLLGFCSKLPDIPGLQDVVRGEAKFVIDIFTKRREQVSHEINASAGNPMELSLLRSESNALSSAAEVIREVWKRRFNEPLL
jgi:hypothetical protein